YFHCTVVHLHGDAFGNDDRFFSDSRHLLILVGFGLSALGFSKSVLKPKVQGLKPYQMLQSTSPPTPAFTALRPVITPRDVVRMLVPRPARTSGTSALPKYTRRPGRLMRCTPVISRSPCGPYFRNKRNVRVPAGALSGDSSST